MKSRKSLRQIISMIVAFSVNDTPSKQDISWVRNEIKNWFCCGSCKK